MERDDLSVGLPFWTFRMHAVFSSPRFKQSRQNHSPNDTASYSRRTNPQQHRCVNLKINRLDMASSGSKKKDRPAYIVNLKFGR